MNNQEYQLHIPRYEPIGFLGFAKEMRQSSVGRYVRYDDLNREQLRNKQLSSQLDIAKTRERTLENRVAELNKVVTDFETQIGRLKTAVKTAEERNIRFEGIQGALREMEAAAEMLSKFVPKKGKQAKEAAKAIEAYRKAIIS